MPVAQGVDAEGMRQAVEKVATGPGRYKVARPTNPANPLGWSWWTTTAPATWTLSIRGAAPRVGARRRQWRG